MKLKVLFGLLLSLLTITLVGCGDDNGSGGAGGTALSGVAAKGVINGATIQVFEILSSGTKTPRGAGLTAIPRISLTPIPGASAIPTTNGNFAVTIPPTIKNGGLLLKLTGGSYTDEATGATVTVNSQSANGLRAAFSNISGAVKRGALTVNITPFTDLGFQALGAASPTDVNIAAANAKVTATFPGLTGVNIFTTKPIDATVAPPAGTTAAQLSYTVSLATISQLTNGGTITLDTLAAQFLPDVQAGVLSQANSDAIFKAEVLFLNSPRNKTGVAIQGLAVAVTPATPTTASTTGTGVPITATVKLNNVNVPDGTQVKFVIKSPVGGSGLSAANASTTGGIATVNLTSTVDAAAFIVTASAGGFSADTALITFANPNKPGAITLSAPATGAINSQVTLTATVTPVSPSGTLPVGTPVTFTVLTGTGTISAVTATNAAGVATASLTSAVAGAVTVKATAGTAPVVSSTPPVSVTFAALFTQAVLKLRTTNTLPAGALIGDWDTDIEFPSTVSINNGTIGVLPASMFVLSGTDAGFPGGLASLHAPAGIHTIPYVFASFLSNPTTIGVTGEVATIIFTLTPPTLTPSATITRANFILNPTNVDSASVPAVSLKPGVDLDVTLSFQ